MLKIALLGELSLTWDGQPLLPIASTRARALFAYLVLNRDRVHDREALAVLFWPDLPEAQARRRLRQALWHIARRVNDLPSGSYLLREGDGVGFNAALPHQVDVDAFDRLSQGDVVEMDEAARLYRGSLLPGVYDDWALLEQERLRERWLTLLDQLAHAYQEEGQPEAATETARVLLQADPWHEPGVRLLMNLLAGQGRAGEALQAYLDLRARLQADLGVAPTAETTDLYRQLRAAHPQTPSPTLSLRSHSRSAIHEREIATLETALRSARQNQGQLILLSGPAGIGKTHLAQTVAAKAHQLGFWTLYARAEEPFGPAVLYSPLDQALRAWLEALGDPPAALSPLGRAALSTLLPDLVRATPELDAAHLPPARFHDALASALVSMTDTGPALLVLDDLHWADPAVWIVLRDLLPRLVGCPLITIAVFRSADLSDAIAPWPDRLVAHSAARSLTLLPPSPEEVGQLAAQLLGRPLPPALTTRIHRETGGNPLFVVETMRGLMEEGDFRPGPDGEFAWPSEEALPIPTSLHQAIITGYTGLAGVTEVWRNDGSNTFTQASTDPTNVSNSSVAWGDYDDDGDLDILLAGNTGSTRVTEVWRNDGSDTFTQASTDPTGVSNSSVAWGDYDDDGDLDILLAGNTGSTRVTEVWRNDGGTFTQTSATPTGVSNGGVTWGDYDDDGDLDILLAGHTGLAGVTEVWRNDGGGTFVRAGIAFTGVFNSSVAWGDYDDDGDLDILLTGSIGSARVTEVWRSECFRVFLPLALREG